MGVELGTAVLVGSLLSLVGTGVSMATTPRAPQQDLTNYDMLRQTQEKFNAESDESRARIEEARMREQLRQNQKDSEGILTSDTGADTLAIRKQVLGVPQSTMSNNAGIQ